MTSANKGAMTPWQNAAPVLRAAEQRRRPLRAIADWQCPADKLYQPRMSERTSPRILHVSQSDRAGGANRATYRLHQALCEAGADSRLWTAYKSQDDPTVI